MNYLLKGLSTSPALRSGDLRGFYDQLVATPIPEGSWLILHDLEGQVLNTLRPFGAALPLHSEFPSSPVERVREKGWSVSGRTASRLKPGAFVVGLSLRVDSEGQPLKHFLTTIVSDVRLRQVMLELRLRGAHTSAFDRDVQPLLKEWRGWRGWRPNSMNAIARANIAIGKTRHPRHPRLPALMKRDHRCRATRPAGMSWRAPYAWPRRPRATASAGQTPA